MWFGLAALVTIGAAALIGRKVISNRRTAEFRRDLVAAEEGARQAVLSVDRQVQEALEHLARPDADPLDRLFLELRKEEGELSPLVRKEVQRRSASLMRAGGLTQLVIAIDGDFVVAAPHFEALVDEKDPRPRALSRRRQTATVGWIEVLREGKVSRVLAAQAARQVTSGPHHVHLLAGRALGAERVDGLRRKGVVEALLVDAAGKPIYPVPGPRGPDRFGPSAPSRRIALPGEDGKPAAFLIVTVNDADLNDELRAVTTAAGALGVLALLFALAVGYLVSRRITRDVDALVEGAQAVSKGDWKYRVPVRGTDELGELAQAFNAMTGQLRDSKARLVQAERVAAWQEIARAIAHEIKNPLTPIQMSVETLRKTYASRHPSFEEIFEESTRTVLERCSA
jgi:two-component system, NtrC family, nitrogen regulation sensor histidine kinase NtrY